MALRQFKNDLQKLLYFLDKFKKNRFNLYTQQTLIKNPLTTLEKLWADYWANWDAIKYQINTIISKYSTDIENQFPRSAITKDNASSIKKTIKELHKLLMLKYNKEVELFTSSRIDECLLYRNNDLVYNQKRMINNLLN